MKLLGFTAGVLTSLSITVSATTHYVWQESPSPTPPYTNWTTAATNIQDAIDDAIAGDKILVTNGVYQTGGRGVYPGSLTNRVAVIKAVSVESVNGPEFTIIVGRQVPGTTNGDSAIRCVYLTNGAALTGFTLTNGATRVTMKIEEPVGGGICCGIGSAMISNCVLVGNAAHETGGGAYRGVLNNCAVRDNSAGLYGGGVALATLNACTLSGNVASGGGGAYLGRLNNCVITGNRAGDGGGTFGARLNNCTVTGNTAMSGGGTFGGLFYGFLYYNNSIVYSNAASNGANYSSGITSVFFTNCCTTPLPLGSGNITNAPLFVDPASGNFHLQLGSPCVNAGNNSYVVGDVDFDGKPRIVGGTVDIGAYEFQTHFVDLNCTNPVPPYINWSTAATNIQDAVDVADAGDSIIVTNGTYTAGTRFIAETYTRVVIDKAITLQSVNGPAWTSIFGFNSASGGIAVRCVYLTNGAMLSGFTLRGGGTYIAAGGGAWCESSSAVVSNCVLSGNHSDQDGGGAYRGTLLDCILTNNSAIRGGGACSNILINCTLVKNFAYSQNLDSGGGAFSCTLTNCLLITNTSSGSGGGAGFSTLNNCTVVGNTAVHSGGGTYLSVLRNCIVYYNTAGIDPNYSAGTPSYCCTLPFATSAGNITNAPLFMNPVGSDLRLQSSSPCINAGKNNYTPVVSDLDRNPRIVGGTVDIGAYEYQTPSSVLSYAWAQQYGLPTDGSADYIDSDIPTGDGMNNWQEWKAGTIPTDSLSVLRLLNPTNILFGLTVQWTSTNTRTYFLERTSSLGSQPFSALASNIPGRRGTTTYTDFTVTNTGSFFYRVGVQE